MLEVEFHVGLRWGYFHRARMKYSYKTCSVTHNPTTYLPRLYIQIQTMKSITGTLAIIALLLTPFAVALPIQEVGAAQNDKDFFIPIPIFVRPATPVVPSTVNSNNKNATGGTANGSASGTVTNGGTIFGQGGDASASNGRK
ncbi:hypothetical protein BD779DRAFT_1673596 [Infundibulicybe gibba]|nr:hypothetical protein BD779DRAFT_1673596 [Infundibulicybe gibba]